MPGLYKIRSCFDKTKPDYDRLLPTTPITRIRKSRIPLKILLYTAAASVYIRGHLSE